MNRLFPLMFVLIAGFVLIAFASRTEQGAMIRADVRKRVGQALEGVGQAEAEIETTVEDAAATI